MGGDLKMGVQKRSWRIWRDYALSSAFNFFFLLCGLVVFVISLKQYNQSNQTRYSMFPHIVKTGDSFIYNVS